MNAKTRTLIQREADDIDRQLFALASRATRLHEQIFHPTMDDLALSILRARVPARAMMHRDDREATK